MQATGHSGDKNFPSSIKGVNDFRGDVLCHSSDFTSVTPNGQGKKVIVVGSCNSGHDIAQEYVEARGYDVTMVQRSSACVITSESVLKLLLAGLYGEGGVCLRFA